MKKYFQLSIFNFPLLIVVLLSSCAESDSYFSSDNSTGQGGSMARFTVKGDYMYTVQNETMKVFDLSVPEVPLHLKSKDQLLRFGAETIFTLDTLLFIGSQDGMYIYNISYPEFPQQISHVSHIRSCDPVVAQGNYAFVTLNTANTWCGINNNMLQVYDISNPYYPELKTVMESPLRSPKGLGVDGNKLFICDAGLKVFDISDPENPRWIDDLDHIREIADIETYDVIPLGGLLLIIGKDGLYQVDYTGERLEFVSKIEVNREEV